MAKLYFRYGAMGSSKTANALMVDYNYHERGKRALLAKPGMDSRKHHRLGMLTPDTIDVIEAGRNGNARYRRYTGKKEMGGSIMDKKEIIAKVDHTLLAQTATWEEIRQICDDAIAFGAASVCIPPSYVERTHAYMGEKMAVCTVIGFPNGYQTTRVKEFETKEAIREGASEIDMVINLGWVKEGRYDLVEEEIRTIKTACREHILKVIVETCLLTEEEKIRMCQTVTEAGADFIKTSTGFSGAGATFADVALFAEHVGKSVKIKAAGGISSFADAEQFLALGASRLGTSRIVKLAKQK